MGGIVNLLRLELDSLKEKDIVFLTLIYAGFSARAICLFTDIKYKHFYVKKSRLYKKIEASNVTHKDLFISKLH